MIYKAVIPRDYLFALYTASAWVMLRSAVVAARPDRWVASPQFLAHSDAIAYMMRSLGPFSIGLLEAISLLCAGRSPSPGMFHRHRAAEPCLERHLIGDHRQFRALPSPGRNTRMPEATAPGWELTAHVFYFPWARRRFPVGCRRGALPARVPGSAPCAPAAWRACRARLPPLDALKKVMFRLIRRWLHRC